MVIGILGAIGSGKTAVAKFLGEIGAKIFSADPYVHRLLNVKRIRLLIESELDVKLPDEPEALRKKIAEIVFNDKVARKRVERILHPKVEEKVRSFIEQEMKDKSTIIVLDIPLLLESGMKNYCDKFLFVSISEEIRLQRLKRERKWNVNEVKIRQQSQLHLSEKRKICDWTIYNGGDLNNTKRQVQKIFNG